VSLTDEVRAYLGLSKDYMHESVRHGDGEYVRDGDIHTNGIENFWAFYKRAWRGTYTHNAVKHTMRYVDERTFAFNARKANDLTRFVCILSRVAGRRLTYTELTDKMCEDASARG